MIFFFFDTRKGAARIADGPTGHNGHATPLSHRSVPPRTCCSPCALSPRAVPSHETSRSTVWRQRVERERGKLLRPKQVYSATLSCSLLLSIIFKLYIFILYFRRNSAVYTPVRDITVNLTKKEKLFGFTSSIICSNSTHYRDQPFHVSGRRKRFSLDNHNYGQCSTLGGK